MNIGIDIDGVILDSERNLKFYADYWSYFTLGKDRLRDDNVTQEECFDWTEEEIRYFYDHYFDAITKKSHLMVGAKEVLKKLKEDGHKLYIITLRGYYRKEERKDAEKKLKQLGIKFDNIAWNTKDKIGKCKEFKIDIMIDDAPFNVQQFANQKIKVLYFKEEPIKDVVMSNVIKVDSWMDIYREIKKINIYKAAYSAAFCFFFFVLGSL